MRAICLHLPFGLDLRIYCLIVIFDRINKSVVWLVKLAIRRLL